MLIISHKNSGGWTVLQNTEYIYSNGTVVPGPELPEKIDEHCAVKINSTHSMIITGKMILLVNRCNH